MCHFNIPTMLWVWIGKKKSLNNITGPIVHTMSSSSSSSATAAADASSDVPDKFRTTMTDFARDLTAVFPEYAMSWSQWLEPGVDMQPLWQHCLTVFPERFFDILNQNAEIFNATSEVNTAFLPGVEFKALYSCAGITEKTRESIWKYLQVILFMLVGAISDKADFGPSMTNLFEGMGEEQLQDKLKTVMESLGNFFGAAASASSSDKPAGAEGEADFEKAFASFFGESAANAGSGEAEDVESSDDEDDPFKKKSSMPNIPKPEEIHKHLMELFNGKIGKLAKELAEDLGEDFAATLGEDMKDATSTQEVLSKLMKDPAKVSGLVKTVGEKLNQKMAAGDISREDIMKEAGDMMKKMKEMGGGQDFTHMFKTMAKGMGVNIPKGAKVDQNAFKQFEKKLSMRDKVLAKAQQRQDRKAAEQAAAVAKREEQLEVHRKLLAAKQQAASATMSVDDIMATLGLTDDKASASVASAGKKKKAKK